LRNAECGLRNGDQEAAERRKMGDPIAECGMVIRRQQSRRARRGAEGSEGSEGLTGGGGRIYPIRSKGVFGMPTTTIHLPGRLLKALDAIAARRKASRNRLVVEACQRLLEEDRGEWPAGFFEMAHLSARDRRELAAAGKGMERAIKIARRTRRRPPFK
jgi:hypothetical protein